VLAGYVLGVIGYALGLAMSAVLDLPSGAVIVWTLAACGLAFALNRRKVAPVRPA
jgi:zinc/manganese transport system permease protein